MGEKDRIYIGMLSDILTNKEKVLNELLEITREQNRILNEGDPETEFDATLEKKEKLLKQLERYDNGFSDTYAKVSAELTSNKDSYKKEITELQKKITGLTDTGVKIQALEEQNRIAFERYLAGEKKKIKDFKVSSKTVSSYYKNMTGKPQGDSYFMDKKK